MAEVAEKTVKKGSQLYIVGKIKTRSYVDKDGNNKYITEILADTFLVLEKKQGSSPSQTQSSDSGRTVVPEKDSPSSDLNDPQEGYQLPTKMTCPLAGLTKNIGIGTRINILIFGAPTRCGC